MFLLKLLCLFNPDSTPRVEAWSDSDCSLFILNAVQKQLRVLGVLCLII